MMQDNSIFPRKQISLAITTVVIVTNSSVGRSAGCSIGRPTDKRQRIEMTTAAEAAVARLEGKHRADKPF